VNISGLTVDVDLSSPNSYHLGSPNRAAPAGSPGGGAVASRSSPSVPGTCSGDKLVSLAPPAISVSGTLTLTRDGQG
jgi:hypothetical protein